MKCHQHCNVDHFITRSGLIAEFFFLASFVKQKPGGLMFPDRASLYVVAIEDRQYKDYKIHCKYGVRV